MNFNFEPISRELEDNSDLDPRAKAAKYAISVLLPVAVGCLTCISFNICNLSKTIRHIPRAIVEHFTPKVDEEMIRNIQRRTDQIPKEI